MIEPNQRVVDMSQIDDIEPDPDPLMTFFGGPENFARITREVERDIEEYHRTGIQPWWMEEFRPSGEWIEQHT